MTSPKSEFFFIDSLKKIKRDNWNNCVNNDHPFLQYEFLLALEESKSACTQTCLLYTSPSPRDPE